MVDRRELDPAARAGTKLVIAGAALALTGVLSITALVVQLLWYEPRCEPVVDWTFLGACGVLRLLILLTLPLLLVGLALLARGLVIGRRARRGPGASPDREPLTGSDARPPR